MPNENTNVVILGGGFAGVYTAKYLEWVMRSAERNRIDVTLVNLENYIVFQPLLPEVISGTIGTLHVISPIRRLAKRAHLHTRQIETVDLQRKTVTLGPGFRPRTMELPYDHLVLSLGTKLNYGLVLGMQEHAIAFKYLGDAIRLRNAIVGVLEEADIENDPAEKRKLLTFVVAGSGCSGVECIAELPCCLSRHSALFRASYRHSRAAATPPRISAV